MTREEIEQVLHAYADAKDRHDLDAIVGLRHEECFDEAVPLGTRVEGREALYAFFIAFFQTVPDYHASFDGEAYGDDTAVVWGRWAGTTTGPFLGIEAEPGCELDIPCVFVCTFRDGLLVGDANYFDLV